MHAQACPGVQVNPLETRSAGLAVASCMNLLFSFVIGQSFLKILCSLKWATFLFFACCVFVMTTIVALFFIETKGVPIEEAPFAFKTHWSALPDMHALMLVALSSASMLGAQSLL